MRVVCDNCGTSYKIPDTKLTKEVNKATCRKCGHAIYIRRPELASVASAPVPVNDERTLITAQPERLTGPKVSSWQPTPAPPAPEPPSARPSGPPPRSVSPTLSPVAGLGESTAPREEPGVRPRPPVVEPSPRDLGGPAPWSPAAEVPADGPTVAEAARGRQAAAPAPVPLHDPRPDLTLVLFAAVLTSFGVLLLITNAMLGNSLVLGAGAFVALLGTFLGFFVVLTGGRGTRPASWVASLVGALVLAALGTAFAMTANWYAGDGVAPSSVAVATPEPAVATSAVTAEPPPAPAPVAVAEPAPPTPEPAAEPTPAPAATQPAATQPAAAPATTSAASAPAASSSSTASTAARSTSTPSSSVSASSSSPSTSSSSASRTSSTSSTSSAPASSRTTSSTTSATSSSSRPTGSTSTPSSSSSSSSASTTAVPISATVMDTMIKSNKAVKKCFVDEKAASGALPTGVKVRFTIQPTGKVSSASIPSGSYAGTGFDACLSSAMKSIAFPPFQGEAFTATYRFPT